MGRLEGRVALVTGAARGQGRSHAVRLAEEGADVVAVDLCEQIATVEYPMATREDLEETGRLVEGLGRRVVTAVADVRDGERLAAVLDEAVGRLGRLDTVVVNAGILSMAATVEMPETTWRDVVDVNLTGAWQTCKAAAGHLSPGGSIVLISSTGGLRGMPHIAHYVAAKHGLVGLMKTLAIELAPHVRVNTVHPTQVDTEMIHNEETYRRYQPGVEPPTRENFERASARTNLLGIPFVESVDVSNAVLFLASDEARYITGVTLPVDAGLLIK